MPGEAGARAAGANLAIVALVIVRRSRHILAAFVFLKCAREQTLQTEGIGPTPCRRNASPRGSKRVAARLPYCSDFGSERFFGVFLFSNEINSCAAGGALTFLSRIISLALSFWP